MEYWPATEVEDIMDEYIKFHPELIGAKIFCLFREKASKSDGVPIIGKMSKVSDRYKCMMTEEYDYIMEIGADAWQELNNDQKEAWVDHLLEHAYGEENEKTGDMTYKLRKPEIMVFPNIVNRHGLNWMVGLPKLKTLPVFQTPDKPVEPKLRPAADETEESDNDIDELLRGLS